MTGSGFEILGSDLIEDEVRRSPRWPRSGDPRALIGAGLVVALVIGGVGGLLWARHNDRVQRASTVTVSAVVTAGIGLAAEGAGVSQHVELAVVNAGPDVLDNVEVTWQDVRAMLSNERQPTNLGTLMPGLPQPASLLLVQACSPDGSAGAGEPPKLAVTATSRDGHQHSVSVTPLGLDRTWVDMTASCPNPDAIKAPTARFSTTLTDVLPRGADFAMTFNNPNDVDVLVSSVRLTQAKGTTMTPLAGTLQIFPHSTSNLVVRITVLDCELALQDGSANAVNFDVANANQPDQWQTIETTPTNYDKAVGTLLFRACGRD